MNRPEDRWKIANDKKIEAMNELYYQYLELKGIDIIEWTNEEIKKSLDNIN